LVGEGEFPREQSIQAAQHIFAAIPAKAKGSALSLSADVNVIERIATVLSLNWRNAQSAPVNHSILRLLSTPWFSAAEAVT
jgi:hypothetical protein